MYDDTDPAVYLILGILAGIFWFFKGFRIYRKYRILADTPEIPIRSAAMGLVEVHGTACDGELIKSPVSGTSCFYSQVKIDVWAVDVDGNGEWRQVATGTRGKGFYLGDKTGKILVDPAGAELDLQENCQAVADQVVSKPPRPPVQIKKSNKIYSADCYLPGGILTMFPREPVPAATPAPSSSLSEEELLKYVAGVVPHRTPGQKHFRGMYRLTEYCILPGRRYDITATCSENPSPTDPQDHNLLKKGENESTFLISTRSETELLIDLRKKALKHIWGGSLLAIASLALFLATEGWLVL